MADYDESGAPIDAATQSPQPVETGVSSDVVTIIAPSIPSLLGLALLIGAIWYFSPKESYFRED